MFYSVVHNFYISKSINTPIDHRTYKKGRDLSISFMAYVLTNQIQGFYYLNTPVVINSLGRVGCEGESLLPYRVDVPK